MRNYPVYGGLSVAQAGLQMRVFKMGRRWYLEVMDRLWRASESRDVVMQYAQSSVFAARLERGY